MVDEDRDPTTDEAEHAGFTTPRAGTVGDVDAVR